MATYFIIGGEEKTEVDEMFSGYVVFYKKNVEASIAAIQRELFSKLIENALKLDLKQFLFIDTNFGKHRFASLVKNIEIQKCFLFGVDESEIGINSNIPMYHLVKLNNIDIIKADAPEILENDKQKKSKLWQELLITFNKTA